MRVFIFTIFIVLSQFAGVAQNQDSLAVENTLEELFTVCNSMVGEGENTYQIIFERLAPYILYTGNDAARNSKDACDYNKTEDRKLVDNMGNKLVNWFEQISVYKVLKFNQQKKGKTEWYYLTISYKHKKSDGKKVFIFTKIKDRYLLDSIE